MNHLDSVVTRLAGTALVMADARSLAYRELIDMLVLNPTVKHLLLAGHSHASVARTVRIRKQRVAVLARTPFHPVQPAATLGVDPWHEAQSLWASDPQLLARAIDAAFEWDATRLGDVAPVQDHLADYRLDDLEAEIERYQEAFARCDSRAPYAAAEVDAAALRIATLRASAAGATETRLELARRDVLDMLATPIVRKVPNHLVRSFGDGGPWFSTQNAWLAERYECTRNAELDEIRRYGRRRPIVDDAADDPRVLARDLILLNLGDARVLSLGNTPEDPFNGRYETTLRRFAGAIGVDVDHNQTYSPQRRSPEEVESEVEAGLARYLTKR